MNKAFFDTYKKLADTEKSELTYTFKDSPVGLRLLEFIEKCTNRNFKNSDAVSFIYSDDKKTPYATLENRFFKLRKKVADEMENNAVVVSDQILTEEELKLYRCKNLTLSDNKEEAFKQLVELENDCWKKNIFELLPSIIDHLIFFNQSFNRNENNKVLFKRLEKAIALQYDMNRCGLLARRIYEINFSKGIKSAKKEMNALKELASKNAEYPRFLMCYHHISLYYKLGSNEYLSEMQVISRHLAEFKKLYAKHSLVPLLSYKVNYVKYQHFHFNQSTMFYHFNRCEFQQAYESMKEVSDLVHSNGSIFKMYKSESLYSNLFTVQCLAGRYDEATATTDFYIAFLKENNQQDKLPLAYTQKARLYADLFPNTQRIKMSYEFLMEQVEEYLKRVRKEPNSLLSLHQVLALKVKLYIVKKEYKKALDLLRDEIVKKHLQELKCFDLFEELIQLLMNGADSKGKAIQDLTKKTTTRKYKIEIPGEYLHLQWILEFIGKLPLMK